MNWKCLYKDIVTGLCGNNPCAVVVSVLSKSATDETCSWSFSDHFRATVKPWMIKTFANCHSLTVRRKIHNYFELIHYVHPSYKHVYIKVSQIILLSNSIFLTFIGEFWPWISDEDFLEEVPGLDRHNILYLVHVTSGTGDVKESLLLGLR